MLRAALVLGLSLFVSILAFEAPNRWLESIIVVVVGAPLAAGVAGLLNYYQYRKQRQAEQSNTKDSSYTQLGTVVLELTDKERVRLEAELKGIAERTERVHAQEVNFLQKQLEHQVKLEAISRNRAHRALGEVQRVVMKLREHEELMRTEDVEYDPFVFKTYEEIIGPEEIPDISGDTMQKLS